MEGHWEAQKDHRRVDVQPLAGTAWTDGALTAHCDQPSLRQSPGSDLSPQP